MFRLFILTTALLWGTCAFAQQFTISGSVQRSGSTQILPGATIALKELNKHALADEYGNFRFDKVAPGTYTLTARFLGYAEKSQTIDVRDNAMLTISLDESFQLTDEVVIFATRASEKTPTTYSEMNKQAIQKQNFGQDLPMVLNWTPSLVTTSDAGAGIGYTGLRIRGTDATRINVTINGIALNDSESQGVFWVNTPDLASSVQSIQVQRGVGTSTNGSGAFGATVSVQTDGLNPDPYAEGTVSAGSFNSRRYTLKGGTGLMHDRWAFDGRVSAIRSDGYLERATSDLNSYYFSGGYYGDKTIVKAIMFGGHEKTYQAWYGVDPATMAIDRRFNFAGAIYDSDGNIERYYDNEVDDYRQDHYQLHLSHKLSSAWNANLSFHYTYGRGFFEQYQQDESFTNLGLPNVVIGNETIESSDVILRKWLDNDYYGTTFSANYDKGNSSLTLGGAFSRYDNARHYGEVLWAEVAVNAPARYVYYDGESRKSDFNVFAKWNYALSPKLGSYVDLQYRTVNYKTGGIEDGQVPYSVTDQFDFFNPKIGLNYALNENSTLYTSYATANREPNRSDYLDGIGRPKSERLGNLEVGWKRSAQQFTMNANFYLMNYTNQLVLTGGVTDTGYPIRANIGKSFRTGVELSAAVKILPKLTWNANVTWSVNRNKDYAFINENNLPVQRNTAIILSPSWIGGSQLTWLVFPDFQATFLSKYVGKQYLDNTENESMKLDAYFINDLRMSYRLPLRSVKLVELSLLINNLFDVEYASNGYGYGGTPYYFPQAGINFLAMVTVKI
ncbi:MAG TPA: TonB-dependent receptor [Chryseolinea sp.]|nr:TonB-dependent receptor [Chryseolinea sp.]